LALSKRIYLKGRPIVADPPGVLGDADTIILRPDDAEIVNGVATTTVRSVGLNLVSRADLKIN